MKKINFKQPKYILPLVVFLPLVFLGYTLTNLFGGGDDKAKSGVVTDNINMSLPDAANQEMGDKMTEMSKRFSEDGAYTAIGALGDDKEVKDSTLSGYGEQELNRIDAENARREQKRKELEDLERSLAESRKHINSYQGRGGSSSSYGSGSRGSSRQEAGQDKELLRNPLAALPKPKRKPDARRLRETRPRRRKRQRLKSRKSSRRWLTLAPRSSTPSTSRRRWTNRLSRP